MEPGGELVESVAVRAVEPGTRVRLAGRQPHLAGEQQFAAAEQREPGRGPLGERAMVSAPRHVYAPHLAAGEAEAGRSRREHDRRVGAGAAAPVLPQPGADGERLPLRDAFPQVPPGEVQDLRRLVRHRKGGQHAVEQERRVPVLVGDRDALPYQPGAGHLDLQQQRQPRRGVARDDREPPPARRRRGLLRPAFDGEGGGERGAVAVPGQPGRADPARRLLRQHAHRPGRVDVVGDPLGCRGEGQGGELPGRAFGEIGAPVQYPGQERTGAVQHQAHPVGTPVQRCGHCATLNRSLSWSLSRVSELTGSLPM
nr:hypothetical protein GCM10020092_038330 [Actinoplanes digitatis]